MWTNCITSIRHVLKLNGYGGPQAKANEKRQRFKGWEILVGNFLLRINGVKTYAVITAEPSSYARRYTKVYYMYSFSYNGNEYKGNSLINSSTGKPGDSIEVVFLEAYPSINRPTSFFK